MLLHSVRSVPPARTTLSQSRECVAAASHLTAYTHIHSPPPPTLPPPSHFSPQLISGGYADFTQKNKHLFAANSEPSSGAPAPSFFTSLERIRLIIALLEASKPDGGCGLALDKEVASGILTAVVPMHDRRVTEALMRTWCKSPWSPTALLCAPSQPLDEIRDYFGEELAMYFAFAGHLTASLVAPMLVGMLVLYGSTSYGSMDNPFCPLYSTFVLLWVTWCCKSWTREQARLAYRWQVMPMG